MKNKTSLEKKLEIAQCLEHGKSVSMVLKQEGVTRRLLFNVIKNANKFDGAEGGYQKTIEHFKSRINLGFTKY